MAQEKKLLQNLALYLKSLQTAGLNRISTAGNASATQKFNSVFILSLQNLTFKYLSLEEILALFSNPIYHLTSTLMLQVGLLIINS